MASGVLSQPGSEFGPCADRCGHHDCIEIRDVAASPCQICGKPIGYDKHYYHLGESEYVHWVCQTEAAENAKAK